MKKTMILTAFAGILLSGCAELLPNFNNNANSASSANNANEVKNVTRNALQDPRITNLTCDTEPSDFCSDEVLNKHYLEEAKTKTTKYGVYDMAKDICLDDYQIIMMKKIKECYKK